MNYGASVITRNLLLEQYARQRKYKCISPRQIMLGLAAVAALRLPLVLWYSD